MSDADEAAFTAERDAITKRYQPQIDALQARAEQMEDDFDKPSKVGCAVGIDFKISWSIQSYSFDLPSITMKAVHFSMDLPDITTSDQHIAFDVPDVRMVDRKVGQYPEFDGWTVRWKDLIISVPEPYMRRVDINMGLPQFAMRTKDMSFDIPHFFMQRQDWKLNLPQIKIINVKAETKNLEDQAGQLQQDGEKLQAQMAAEYAAAVARYVARATSDIAGGRSQVSTAFDQALNSVNQAINTLVAQKCDPIKVPTTNGDVNLRKVYSDLADSKTAALKTFDEDIAAA